MARLGALANGVHISPAVALLNHVSQGPSRGKLTYFAASLDETVEIRTHLLE